MKAVIREAGVDNEVMYYLYSAILRLKRSAYYSIDACMFDIAGAVLNIGRVYSYALFGVSP